MAELLPQERLQPSLLDRLTDHEPEAKSEPRDKRVMTLTQLRGSVLRDVGWLLNVVHLHATRDLSAYPQVQKSTLNFGIPDLCGSHIENIDSKHALPLADAVKRAILAFEPRILHDGLKVTVYADREHMSRHALSFVIEGRLWARPVPQSLYLRTELDLETGTMTIAEGTR